jgi:glutaredoxin-related protein
VFDTLDNMKIPYHAVDVASSNPAKTFLREHSPQQLLVPQLFVDGVFRAGYSAFVEAVEEGQMEELLKNEAREFPLH